MATNWELARLKSLVKRDRDITPEDRDFWLKIVDKPGSAVKYSKEIRSILEVLEFRDTSKMTDEAIQAIKDGKAKESAELSTRVNRIANSHKTDTENSFYTTKMSAVKTKIIGQDEVLADIKKKLFVSALLMNNGVNQKPRAFIFAGGSTNGKTAMATKIGEMICDGSLKIQMSNFKSETDVSLITGTSPGYVGATEKSLIETYMESAEGKYCIIFDEIEKAPPKIFRFLIEILDTGYLTLLNGKSLDLRNSIIMFTTNAGVETIGDTIGFQTVEKNVSSNGNTKNIDRDKIVKAIENILPPETMNRIGRDNVYVFRDLSESDKKIIVDNMIDEALNELDDSVRGLTNDKYTKKLRGLLKKEALKVTVGKLCTRSLRELKEAVIDTIILTAANVNGK